MKSQNNRNNHILFSFIQERILWFLLLLFVHNFYAQIFISEGVSLYDANKVLVSQTDSLVSNSQKTKIYISSGVQFSNLDSEKNYEVVEIFPEKNKKTEAKKQSLLKIAKTESEKKVEEKRTSEKENPALNKHIISSSESEVDFYFAGSFSKTYPPISQSNLKHIFSSEICKNSLAFAELKLVSVYFKTNEVFTAQNKISFSVRPPPSLI